jgi:polyhydroxyalkanoate synthase
MADPHDDQTAGAHAADPGAAPGAPDLAELQHWTWVMGRAQQMMMEQGLGLMTAGGAMPEAAPSPLVNPALVRQTQDYWRDNLALWQRFVDPAAAVPPPPQSEGDARDKRFKAAAWRDDPWFDLIRRSYNLIADHMLRGVDALDGVPERYKEQMRFAARGLVEAMSPSNFPLTNPEVVEKTIATKGQNLLDGLRNMLADIQKGQLTHTSEGAFEVGRNLATTPGKVVRRTPLYELIQYTPTTERVMTTPLVIFPPWINRFYILDLTPEKSFIRWAAEQGITVFMVSWKSADASMKDVVWDDYVTAQVDAVDTIRAALDVPAVHTIGYCVAGTTLAATQ